MLKGCGNVLTAKTNHVLSHITSEHLIKRSRLLRLVVNSFRDFSGDKVRPLQRLDKVPKKAIIPYKTKILKKN